MNHRNPPSFGTRWPRSSVWMALVALLACLAVLPAMAEERGSPTWQSRSPGPTGELGIYRVQPKDPGVTVFRGQPDSGYRRQYERYERRPREHGTRSPSAYDRFYERPSVSRRPEFSGQSWYTQRGGGDHWRRSSQSARRGWYGDLGWRDESLRRRDGRSAGSRGERGRIGGGWAPGLDAPGWGGR